MEAAQCIQNPAFLRLKITLASIAAAFGDATLQLA
jgi:hypothetical protein